MISIHKYNVNPEQIVFRYVFNNKVLLTRDTWKIFKIDELKNHSFPEDNYDFIYFK